MSENLVHLSNEYATATVTNLKKKKVTRHCQHDKNQEEVIYKKMLMFDIVCASILRQIFLKEYY